MTRASPDEARLLFTDWKERGLWIGVGVFLGEDSKEEHKFLAKVASVGSDKLALAGEHALVEIPLEPDAVFEYSETSEAPASFRNRFAEFEFCFVIRSQRVVALLFGQRPKTE